MISIADYLIKNVNVGWLRMDRPGYVYGMGIVWKFIPNRRYGPGILVNEVTDTILGAAELADRYIDPADEYFDWQIG